MASDCAGCQAREDEVKHLRAQNADLIDRAMANANPQLAMHLRHPSGSDTPAITQFEDGVGNQYVQVDGSAVPLSDWQAFMKTKSGVLVDGMYVPADEYERTIAQAREIAGGVPPH